MKRYHPIFNFMYFFIVIGFAMFLKHPVFLLISLLGGLIYTWHLFGFKESSKSMGWILFLMLFTALLNPAFSHQGVTVLAVLPTGNMLTLESILYGIGLAIKLATVLVWFGCASEILTADKIMYIFGKTMPVLALMLSMILGFIPKMRRRLAEIDMAAGETKNIRQGLDKLYTLITWSLEDGAKLTDSMHSRGYGLKGRTAFTRYRFTNRDKIACIIAFILFVVMLMAALTGYTYWYYYPEVKGIDIDMLGVIYGAAYALLCFLPVLIDGYEEIKWNSLQSEI